jgi:hypothetical protein
MARVPVITSPCPLRWKSMPSAGMDFCSQCSRRVHNLDAMSDAERGSFFATCSGEVCVAYTVRRPHVLAGVLGIAAALGGGAVTTAFAQDEVPTVVTGPTCDPDAKSQSIELITVGGVQSARDVKWIDEREAQTADAPQIGEIDPAEWLPTPDDAHASK